MARNGDGLFHDRIWCFRYKDQNGVLSQEKSTGERKQSGRLANTSTTSLEKLL